MSDGAFSLAAPLLTAVITVGGVWWKEAQQRRSREQVRQRILAQMRDEIAMIEAWAKAHASLGPSAEPLDVRDRAKRDLDVAYNRMRQFAPEVRQPVTLQTIISRLFLRHLRMSLGVRLLRYIYYLALVMLIVWGAVGFSQPKSWMGVGAVFVTLTTYFAVAVAPAWLLGWLTTYFARRQETT